MSKRKNYSKSLPPNNNVACSEKKPHKPHDGLFRSCMKNQILRKDFLQRNLPKAILELFDLESLVPCDPAFITTRLVTSQCDILFRVNTIDGEIGYINLEHSTDPPELLAFHLSKYRDEIIHRHLEEFGESAPLPIVYNLVVCVGDKPYNKSTDLANLYNKQSNLARELFCSPFDVFDVKKKNDEDILSYTPILSAMLMLLKYAKQMKKAPPAAVAKALQRAEAAREDGELLNRLYFYTIMMMEVKSYADLCHKLSNANLTEAQWERMMTSAQALQSEGEQIGFTKGEQIGFTRR